VVKTAPEMRVKTDIDLDLCGFLGYASNVRVRS